MDDVLSPEEYKQALNTVIDTIESRLNNFPEELKYDGLDQAKRGLPILIKIARTHIDNGEFQKACLIFFELGEKFSLLGKHFLNLQARICSLKIEQLSKKETSNFANKIMAENVNNSYAVELAIDAWKRDNGKKIKNGKMAENIRKAMLNEHRDFDQHRDDSTQEQQDANDLLKKHLPAKGTLRKLFLKENIVPAYASKPGP